MSASSPHPGCRSEDAEGMSDAPVTYQKAATAADAVSALPPGGLAPVPGRRTTLYDLMKLNVEVPSHIVDINSLSELKAFDTSGPNELSLGRSPG